MLMWPKYNMPFEPTICYWLGGISIFDREETLGVRLWAYDPNILGDREKVIDEFILPRFDDLTYRHRFKLYKILDHYLSLPDFDFSTQFESDYDADTCLAWDETEIADPRGFFEDIHRMASVKWKADLQKASLEDQSTW